MVNSVTRINHLHLCFFENHSHVHRQEVVFSRLVVEKVLCLQAGKRENIDVSVRSKQKTSKYV
jgi:hypothetical protein